VKKAFRFSLFAFACAAAALLAGCSLIPSTWWIGGSPLAKVEKKEAAKTAARELVLQGAQEAMHKTNLALDEITAPDRPAIVAQEYGLQAQDLVDQALGIPPEANAAAWRNLVKRLISDNAQIRAQAEKERTADTREISRLSDRFAQATAAAQRANTRALDYARESEGYANFARYLKLGFFGLIGLIALGTILSLASRFFPALGLASKIVNGVVAPGITFVAHRAEAGLKAVGQGLAALRKGEPQAEQLIERYLDPVTDQDHQAIIAAASAAAAAKVSSP
jgi:hypothetical protein